MLHFIWNSRSWSLEEEASDTESKVYEAQSVILYNLLVLVMVGPLCPKSSQRYLKILGHLMLPSADKLNGNSNFLFKLNSAPTCSNQMLCWFCYYCARLPDLNPTENLLLSRGRRKKPDPKIHTKLKAAIKATWTSITMQQWDELAVSIPHCALLHKFVFKEPKPRTECYKWADFSRI